MVNIKKRQSDPADIFEAEAEDAWATTAKAAKSRKKRSTTRPIIDGVKTEEVVKPEEAVATVTDTLPTLTITPMPAARTLPLLVCSVGNPGSSYANTLHSAGHTVLNHLAERLGYSSFQKDRSLGNGLVSKPPSRDGGEDWTLWQSTSFMNESGKGVRSAWTKWSQSMPQGECKLVIVYDELEKALGTVTLRTAQGASAKGHNGLKSIMSAMGKAPFARIGVGIGRPASRESDDVARYVLKKMTPAEKSKIEESVEEVVANLKQLQAA